MIRIFGASKTLNEFIKELTVLQKEHGDAEVFVISGDGDLYAAEAYLETEYLPDDGKPYICLG